MHLVFGQKKIKSAKDTNMKSGEKNHFALTDDGCFPAGRFYYRSAETHERIPFLHNLEI